MPLPVHVGLSYPPAQYAQIEDTWAYSKVLLGQSIRDQLLCQQSISETVCQLVVFSLNKVLLQQYHFIYLSTKDDRMY